MKSRGTAPSPSGTPGFGWASLVSLSSPASHIFGNSEFTARMGSLHGGSKA